MPRRVTTKEDTLAAVSSHRANHSIKDVSPQTGVAVRKWQHVVKHFMEEGGDAIPEPHKKTGIPKLISLPTQKVISWQVKANPRITAHKMKKKNPWFLTLPAAVFA